MKLKLSWLALAAGAVFSVPLPGSSLQAQTEKPKKVIETAAVKGRGAAAADENIKKPRPADDSSLLPAPPSKGGAQTRGSACYVVIDNRSNLYADIYLDGTYRGTVDAYGDAWAYVGCGETRLYARTRSGSFAWGPTIVTVDEQGYTMLLKQP